MKRELETLASRRGVTAEDILQEAETALRYDEGLERAVGLAQWISTLQR